MDCETPMNKWERTHHDLFEDDYQEINPDDEEYQRGVPLSSLPELEMDYKIWEKDYNE